MAPQSSARILKNGRPPFTLETRSPRAPANALQGPGSPTPIPSRRDRGWVRDPTKAIPAEATARPQIRHPNHSCRGPGLDPKSDSHFIPAKTPNLTRYPTLNPRHGSFLEPGIWALFCVGTGVPQQLGDTRFHTKQCPDSGRQKKTTQQEFLAYMNLPANGCNTPPARPRLLFQTLSREPMRRRGVLQQKRLCTLRPCNRKASGCAIT